MIKIIKKISDYLTSSATMLNKEIASEAVYKLKKVYKNKQGEVQVIASVSGTPKTDFKISVEKLVENKRKLLSKFDIDDIISILSFSKSKTINKTKKVGDYKLFLPLSLMFTVSIIASNISAFKLCNFFGFTITGAALSYCFSYLLSCIIVEVYGFKRMRLIIWMAMLCNLLVMMFLEISIFMPPAAVWSTHQIAYQSVLSSTPIIWGASFLATLCGEFVNGYLIAKIKISKNNPLWLRLLKACAMGVFIDSVIFVSIAYYGVLDFRGMAELVLSFD